jgi:hypothetical protein
MSATAPRIGFPQDALSAAELYIGMDLAPIPLPPRSKNPGYDGWPALRLTPDSIDQHFPSGEVKNVGILNGAPSHNTLDVDLDCAEALAVAQLLLPATGWIFGRKSNPKSHYIYRTDAPLETAQEEYQDLDGRMLVELRGTGGLTVYPPSLHKDTGERVAWDRFTEPGQVQLADLQRAVGRVAAAALLARHWPATGSRDAAAMALSGALLRGGWNEEKVSRFVRAVAVAAGDEEARMRAAKAGPTAKKQEDGKKTTGWPALEEVLGEQRKEVVRRVRDWLGLSALARIAEVPEAAAWPDPPANEAFHGLAGRIVRTIEPSTEADPAALLVQMMVAFGSAAGRSAHFRVEADYHYSNEYAVLIGRTSKARKGTSWGRISRLMEQAEENWHNERVASGVSSGEGVIWAVRDAIQSRERTKEGKEVKYVDVEKDPGIQDKRLLIYEPEFANVLKQTERQGNTASVVLRQAWDGNKVLRTLTKNSPAKATGAHISIVGHVTGEELQRYLTQTETANGFANRFMFVCAGRSKLLPEGGYVDAAALDALRGELVEALAFAKSAGELKRDEEARELWCQIYGELSDGRPGLAGALLARAEAHVMRLALLYALLDRSTSIRAPHLLAALALWDYCERSVRYIFGDSLGDDVADELLRLLRGCLPNGMTRSDISNYFQRNVSANKIGKALGLLLQNNHVRREGEETGGRKAERWFAVRK